MIQPINRLGVLITSMIATVAMIMSSTMANVAIPNIMGAFGIGQDQAHWVSTGFYSAMTAGLLLNGWLVTNFGPRNIFISALTVFSFAGFIGQYAPTFEGVVLARIAQGFCAGIIQPLALTTVFLAYPPEKRGQAMGWFGLTAVFGPTIGPVLGGFIVDFAQWRFVFVAAVPMMLIGSVMAWLFIPGRTETVSRTPLNIGSFFLITGAFMLFLNGISSGQRDGWDTNPVFFMLFSSIILFVLFLIRENRGENSLLKLRLFSYRAYIASALVAFIFGAGMFGSLYIIPVMVQTVQGLTALEAGLMLLPGGLVSLLVFPFAGRLSAIVHPSYTMTVGLAIFGLSCWLLAGTGILTGFWMMALLIALGRIGLGLVIPSLNLSAMSSVPQDLVPFAAGTMNFVRFTGASLGINTLAIIIDSKMIQYGSSLLETQTFNNLTTQEFLGNITERLLSYGLSASEGAMVSKVYLKNILLLKAQESAFQDGYMALLILFILGMFATMMLFKKNN
ncbi:MAG: DHA2 family efflux MFS transporter permease subunit [Rhodospirillaceae bacterium]|nr:DHA2 family efflux MFS transporter permease subunit [Rhodospirillaceae bacterium]